MSILSDCTIHTHCSPPTHIFVDLSGWKSFIWQDYTHNLDEIQSGISNYTIGQIVPETALQRGWTPMITPYHDGPVRLDGKGNKIVSWGRSAYGYDVRLANKFKVFTNVHNAMIDPLNVDDKCYVDLEGDYCIIPPNSYILGHTIETFDIPRDVMAVCVGKSTYARLGAIVNVTPIEPGFKGQVVIEIANTTTLPLKVYANQGIAQFLFFRGDRECLLSYADKNGKYMHQQGIQTALL